jgi:imidazolonepropionase
MMPQLHIRNARVLTLAGPRPRRGRDLSNLAILPHADVLIQDDRIASVTTHPSSAHTSSLPFIDAAGRILMPGFIDCHTHACWAGDRLDEWAMKLAGAAYLDILKAGGGIMSTVRAVRAASEGDLVASLQDRLRIMLSLGTTTAEVKSGYGLDTDAELKMLRAISRAASSHSVLSPLPSVLPTALLGHAIDSEIPSFPDHTITQTLPAIHAEFPGFPIDAFCETGAWSLADSIRLLTAAKKLGHPIRIHADQFNSLGMTPAAISLGALSVDHLEASTPADLEALARSDTFGVILPACGFNVDGRYARMRAFLDAGGLLALATNFNPGSAPSPSMPMAIALAVRHCGLTPAEAIAATTVNPASLLNLSDRGSIEPGKRADLILLRHTDERMLAYEFGTDPIDAVILGGQIVKGPAPAAPRA